MATQHWVRQALQAHEVPFQELHHGLAFTAQHLAEVGHISGRQVAKVVVVMADERPVETVLPASRILDFNLLRGVLDCQECRLATEVEISQRFNDCEIGAIPPMRRWPGIELLMDASLESDDDIIFAAGTHRDAIRMNFGDWASLVVPRVANFSRPIAATRSDTGVLADFEEWEM